MKTITLSNNQQKTFIQNLISEMPVDGSMTVIVKKTDLSATAKQRRLNWMWCDEVSRSGLGRDDTKEGVHTTCKWMFARPILLRDDAVFGAVFQGFSEMVTQIEEQDRAEFWREFTRFYISTEQMTRQQRAEYLREFEMYWRGKGVELTDPAMQGLDRHLGYKEAL